MNSPVHPLSPPHFTAGTRPHAVPPARSALEENPSDPGSAVNRHEIGALIMRGAECLSAALVECTARSGLNEARYRVLHTLRRRTEGECSQAELADLLLQSESNLSTLLERMSGDGLITRTRSQTDRRRSLIGLAPAGLDALSQAELARSAAISKLMKQFAPSEALQLAGGLQRLVGDLERSLEVSARRASGFDPAFTTGRRSASTVSPARGGE
ncbi:MAG: MarR family transcriptional regulator [Planctomycetaceae bacterium]|nr:MarR family transcriptional regulator [Planctomycetaceae bacterium]